jgi:hypothetical protein
VTKSGAQHGGGRGKPPGQLDLGFGGPPEEPPNGKPPALEPIPPGELATLRQARDWLIARLEEGALCPCCTQIAKEYHRPINSTMARDLIVAWRAYGTRFGYLQEVRRVIKAATGHSNREEPKLRYWGLMEEENVRRPDGGRAGWWRVTPDGEDWVLGRSVVPKYAWVYDNRLIALDRRQHVTIREALGHRFNYDELMRGV